MAKNSESLHERFERLNRSIKFVVDPAEYDRAKVELETARSDMYAADVAAAKAAEYESAKLADLETAKRNQVHKERVVSALAEIDACETKRARLEDKMLAALSEAYNAAVECISNSDAIYQNMNTAHSYGESIGEVYPEGILPIFDNRLKIAQTDLIKLVFTNYLDIGISIAGMREQGIEPKYDAPGRWLLCPPMDRQKWLYSGKVE
jgi:hypothetical protein